VVAAELALVAVRAVEDDLRGLVIGQVVGPVLGVLGQPRPLALGAPEDGCGTFSAHVAREIRGSTRTKPGSLGVTGHSPWEREPDPAEPTERQAVALVAFSAMSCESVTGPNVRLAEAACPG